VGAITNEKCLFNLEKATEVLLIKKVERNEKSTIFANLVAAQMSKFESN
jgi:hypothetical protein